MPIPGPPEGFRESKMTNGEARTMAALISGYDPSDIDHYIVIVQTESGALKGTTDMCSTHAGRALLESAAIAFRTADGDSIDCSASHDDEEDDNDN